MTRILTASEAKAKLLALLDEVETGEEVEITRRGKPVARLVPAAGAASLRGVLVGVALSAAPEDELFATDAAWDVT